MQEALYGPAGFYRRPEGPAGHFRTSVSATPVFAEAVVALLARVDAALGRPERLDFVDVGAGRGDLLMAVRNAVPASISRRLRLHGVELAARPTGLPGEIAWSTTAPTHVQGLALGNEWLDNVPFDVVETDNTGGTFLVHVEPETGAETPGRAVEGDDLAWLQRWWPPAAGERAEVGVLRDQEWAGLLRRFDRGLAVAIDYATDRDARLAGAYAHGTVTAYRSGRQVLPVPDGNCDITAAVALDACAEAGRAVAGAGENLRIRQRDAVHALLPRRQAPVAGASAADLLDDLRRAGEIAELCDPAGLGAFTWLLQSIGIAGPAELLGTKGA